MNIYDKINDLYNKQTYYQKYGLDIWKSLILIGIVAGIISYIYVKAHAGKIKSNWNNEKCKPNIIPFAGIINSQTGGKENSFDYTIKNMNECVQTITGDISKYITAPLHYNIKNVGSTFKELSNSVDTQRGMFSNMRKNVTNIGSSTYEKTLQSTIPLMKHMIYTKDTVNKTTGTITSAIYTLFGGYITLIGFFRFMYDLIIDVIGIIVGVIIFCFAIGWLFPPTLIAGIGLSIALVALLIPVLGIKTFMADALNTPNTRNPPNVPTYCFGKHTKFQMKDKTWKYIYQIEPGERLIDNTLITAIMKSTSKYSKMYKLCNVDYISVTDISNNTNKNTIINEYIIVSGNHLVRDENNEWIFVSEHPKSEYISDFKEDYIYCLGTSTKEINIGDYVFSDWDEMYKHEYENLQMNNKVMDILPKNFNKYDIHKYLDTGLKSNTLIPMLENGKYKEIKDIKINDILKNNIVVCSVIKVYCKDVVEYYDYYYINNEQHEYLFQGTNHIYLGEIETKDRMNRKKRNSKTKGIFDDELIKIKKRKPYFVYHLVTNKGYFNFNENIKIMDYNHSIERFLYT